MEIFARHSFIKIMKRSFLIVNMLESIINKHCKCVTDKFHNQMDWQHPMKQYFNMDTRMHLHHDLYYIYIYIYV